MPKQLPKQVIKFNSADKEFHQKPDLNDMGNLCSPSLVLIANGKNCGKTRLAKNFIAKKNLPYQRIVVYSPMPDTEEYTSDIDCEMINDIYDIFNEESPSKTIFDRNERNLLVCDDLDMKNLRRDDQRLLSDFFRFHCTHNNIDIIIIVQNLYDTLPICRRIADIVILFNNHDAEFMKTLSKKFSIPLDDFKYIFKNLITEKTDSLLIDESRPEKYRLRKNIYEIINIKH